MSKDSHQFSVYVDGSYRNGRSGYGVVALSRQIKGDTQVNRQFYIFGGFQAEDGLWQLNAEFAAAVTAIEFAVEQGADKITLYYDCEAIEYWARRKALAKARFKTQALFEDYNRFMRSARRSIQIEFRKVPAHKNNVLNNEADRLAKHGLKQKKSKIIRLSNPVPVQTRKRKKAA